MRNHIIIVASILVAVAIGVLVFIYGNRNFSGSEIKETAESSTSVSVPFTKLIGGETSQITKRTNYLITSTEELNELWKIIDTKENPPTIDFSKDYVAAVFAGQRPTVGYSISVTKIEDVNTRVVSINLAKPSNDCVLAQSVTTPYEVIKMPVTTLHLTHKDNIATSSCK